MELPGKWRLVARAGLAVVTAAMVWHAYYASFGHDEIEHLHAAWLVHIGQRPFIDFVEQHHPTYWYLIAPLTALPTRALVVSVRLIDLGCLGGVLWALTRMVQRLYPTVDARGPVLLAAASFMLSRNMMSVHPDTPMNLFVYLGLYEWVEFLDEPRGTRAGRAGLYLGLAVAALQKALSVVGLLGASLALLLLLHRRDRARCRRLFIGGVVFALGFALPVFALFFAMAHWNSWRNFWFLNYGFNSFLFLQRASSYQFSIWRTIGQSAAEDCVLWAAGVVGAGLAARQLWRAPSLSPRDDGRSTLLFVGAGYLLFLSRSGFPYGQYFMIPLPLLGLFSTELFARASPRQLHLLYGLTAVMLLVLTISLVAYSSMTPQIAFHESILARTTPDQTVSIPPQMNPIYRKDASLFWYNGAQNSDVYAGYCAAHPDCPDDFLRRDDDQWRKNPPAFVYIHPQYKFYTPYHWELHRKDYRPSGEPDLWVPIGDPERP